MSKLLYEIKDINDEIKDINDNFTDKRIEDIKRISKALFNYYGIVSNFRDIYDLWEEISDSWFVGWLTVPEDEKEIINIIKEIK